ncbi:MAG TPA: carbohydrate binding domain-containing protein [Tepidisphaeraceae bacterium]|jgi:hypothetical protein|nr:carbohydrate binding domain-containing protein [Tepidisphaeraceae bacterium]
MNKRSIVSMATAVVSVVGSVAGIARGQDPMVMSPMFPFVLPWDDVSENVTNVSSWLDAPAGKHGFIAARGPHLYAGEQRFRFFGVNMAFGANFPQKDDADKVAARMARFGINCVRFHHMDMFAAPAGIMTADMKGLDAQQLDKLDFFVAALKQHGIYSNINLHVSRVYPDMPGWENAPDFHKGVDLFYPPMIEAQRDFARQLLSHVNPYTETSYADEPAVAIVEINNENGLLQQWWGGALDAMPEPIERELHNRWNAWLNGRYASLDDVRKQWQEGAEPLGEPMLRNSDFAQGMDGWTLERHGEADANATIDENAGNGNGGRAIRITVDKPSSESWHVQLVQPGLSLSKGKAYTLSMRMKASGDLKNTNVAMAQSGSPWNVLASSSVPLTDQWKDVTLVLRASADEPNARLMIGGLAAAKGEVSIANLSLRPGGRGGLKDDAKRGDIPIVTRAHYGALTESAQRDWITFLYETEETYWTEMSAFLKNDLGVKSLVVGSATGFSPSSIQAKLDVVDVHGYWQHPHFPNKPWDQADWVVNNLSMAGAEDGGQIPGMALRRVAGRPYICTEYNAASPNTHSSETFLLLSAYAAMQDWDGIFAFAYSHRTDDWAAGKIPNFFDIDQHPTKLVTLPAAAAMFLRGDVTVPDARAVVNVSREEAITQSMNSGPWWHAGALGIDPLTALVAPVAIDTGDATPTTQPAATTPATAAAEATTAAANAPVKIDPPTAGQPIVSRGGELTWDAQRKYVTINTPRSKAFIGEIPADQPIALGTVKLTLSPNLQNWAAVSMTAIDGPDFQSPGRFLITVTGSAENTRMGWKNAERNTVGRDWGESPSLVEGIGGTITFENVDKETWAWVLDERGQRRLETTKISTPTSKGFQFGRESGTIWYEVEIGKESALVDR